jgi:tRNA (guanine37-N1)-methyltransferase
MEVPEVLTGGNHKLIELWKYEQSLALTKERRPDLFEEYVQNAAAPDKDHKKILERYLNSDKMKVCASGIKDEKE